MECRIVNLTHCTTRDMCVCAVGVSVDSRMTCVVQKKKPTQKCLAAAVLLYIVDYAVEFCGIASRCVPLSDKCGANIGNIG